MQKIKQILFASLFFVPLVLFLAAAFLPLLNHKSPHLVYAGLVPLYAVVLWQAYQRTKKPPQ